jgi:hypothetical protein
MRDILLDGIPILDLLEITASTGIVAALSNCDQSSVSRSYRRVSGLLGLEFRKTGGLYRAHANQDLLHALRQAAQLLRLSRGWTALQWLAPATNADILQALKGCPALPRSWAADQRTLELVQERVLDLAVVNGLAALPPGWEDSSRPFRFGDWVAVGLVRYRLNGTQHPLASTSSTDLDAVVLRQEHLEHPSIQALISRIRAAYQRAGQQLPDPVWL